MQKKTLSVDGHEISFFDVPLVCGSAPHIGCGSKAKFILNDLTLHEAVAEAWLNRAGTVMAVVWNSLPTSNRRAEIVNTVFQRHRVPTIPSDETLHNDLAKSFATRTNWYKGSQVDQLSIEEAGVIADQIMTQLIKSVSFRSEQDRLGLYEDIKQIFEDCFLSLRSFQELNAQATQRMENEIRVAGEKYLGKGNMPKFGLALSDCDTAADEASCC